MVCEAIGTSPHGWDHQESEISIAFNGTCLYWYMRNRLYFDLNLHMDPRVLIVQYEDTVLNQEKAFRRIFDFLGFLYDPAIIDGLFASSVDKHPWPGIDPRIQEVCDDLKIQLDAHYAGTSGWAPENWELTDFPAVLPASEVG